MDSAELKFILRMRDEATAILKRHAASLRDTGRGAKELGDEGKKATASLKDVAKAAGDVAQAVAGIAASAAAIKGATSAYGNFEQGIAQVASIAGMSKNQVDAFSESFVQLNREIKTIPREQLVEMEATLAQMGIAGKDLTKVGKTVAQLSMATGQATDTVAEVAARLLYITGEPLSELKKFGDTLSYLDRNAAATSGQILDLANNIAVAVPNYKISSAAILTLATSMANAGMRSELTRSAIQRVMAALYQGSKKGTAGFRDFLRLTGLTKEKFDELSKTHPEEILLKFSDAYNRLSEAGKGQDFLKEFNVQAQETQIVLGVLGSRANEIRENLKKVSSGAATDDLKKRFDIVNETQNADLSGLIKGWTQLKAAIGEAIAPLAVPILNNLTDGAYALRDIFKSLSPMTKTFVAVVGTAAPLIWGAVRAATALKVVFALLGGSGGLAGALKSSKGALAAAGGEAGAAAGVAAGTKAVAGMKGILGKFLKGGILLSLAVEGGKLLGQGIAAGINAAAPDIANKIADWRDNSTIGKGIVWVANNLLGMKTPRQQAEEARKQMEEAQKAQEQAQQQAKDQMEAAQRQAQLEGGLDGTGDTELTGTTGTIKDVIKDLQAELAAAKAVTGAQKDQAELQERIRQAAQQTGLTYDDVSKKIGGIVAEIQKARTAAAVDDLLRGYDQQIEDAKAVTAEQKNQVEITRAINDLERERGHVTEQQKKDIRDRLTLLQQERSNAAYHNELRDLDSQLATIRAITSDEKIRAEVVKTISDFERENGRRSDAERLVLATKITQLKTIQQYQEMQSRFDPIGTARREYDEQLKILNAMREKHVITEDYYRLLKKNLDEQTRAQRDPIGDRIKSLREELSVAGMSIKQGQIEAEVLQEVNSLRRQGVENVEQYTGAIREYLTALYDLDQAKQNGFGGFINDVGELKDNLMSLQKDFASGLSDAISGAISGAINGESGTFTSFLNSFGKKMVQTGINQLMAQALKGLGAQSPQEAAFKRADAALAKLDALNQAGIKTPQAIITAGSVSINGQQLNQALNAANDNKFGPLAANDNSGGGTPSTAQAVDNVSGLLGLNENANRGQINAFLKKGGVNIDAARTAWCAAFVNSALEQVGVDGTGKLNANSFLKWGQKVDPSQVMKGDVLVDSNGFGANQTGGHVGFATGNKRNGANGLELEMLSGNSSNSVTKRWYDASELTARRATPDMMPDTSALTAATQQVQQSTQQVATALQTVNPALQQTGTGMMTLGQQTQTATTAVSTAAPAMTQLNMATQQTGTVTMQTGQQMQTAGQQIQAAGTQAATAGQNAATAQPGFGNLAQGIQGLQGPLNQVVPGLGSFASGILGLVQSLLSGGQGGGGGMGGIGSLLGLGMMFLADGGKISGPGNGTSDSILAAVSNGEFVVNAKATKQWGPVLQAINDNEVPKFAQGGRIGGNVVQLRRGESEMASGRKGSSSAEVEDLSNQVAELSKAVAKSAGSRNRVNNNSVNMNVYPRDYDSFRRSQGQVMADAQLKMNRFAGRNN